MEVLIASRKGTSSTPIICSTPARVSFEEVLKRATVLFLSVPKIFETTNLISSPELETMSPKTVIINISRGGIVDEAAVVSALKQGMIAGYGTDVTTIEPAEWQRRQSVVEHRSKRFEHHHKSASSMGCRPDIAQFGADAERECGAVDSRNSQGRNYTG